MFLLCEWFPGQTNEGGQPTVGGGGQTPAEETSRQPHAGPRGHLEGQGAPRVGGAGSGREGVLALRPRPGVTRELSQYQIGTQK